MILNIDRTVTVSVGSMPLPAKGYISISIPEEMVKEIDKVVKKRRYGYTSRADVVADAIRRLMAALKSLSR